MEPLKESVVAAIVKRVLARIDHGSEFSIPALIQFEIPKEYKADRRDRYFKAAQLQITQRSVEARQKRAAEKGLAAKSAKEAERRYP